VKVIFVPHAIRESTLLSSRKVLWSKSVRESSRQSIHSIFAASAIQPLTLNMPRSALSYRDAGVDIDQANLAKRKIRSLARSTFTPGVLTDIGGFGALFRLPAKAFSQPVLVSSVDGVGTKLKVAFETGIHHTVGKDLVAHCVNDILVQGATPLF